MIKILIS